MRLVRRKFRRSFISLFSSLHMSSLIHHFSTKKFLLFTAAALVAVIVRAQTPNQCIVDCANATCPAMPKTSSDSDQGNLRSLYAP